MANLTIGKVLKSFRLGEDLTIKELSQKLGVSAAYISKLESDGSSPTYNMLEKYASYFNVKVSDITFWAEQTDDAQNRIKNIMFGFLKKK